MSLIRWGEEGSKVYVIGLSDGSYQCVNCSYPYHRTKDPAEFLIHLLDHQDRGDTVPEILFDRLKADTW